MYLNLSNSNTTLQVASKESYSDISGTIFLAKKRNVLFFKSQVVFFS